MWQLTPILFALLRAEVSRLRDIPHSRETPHERPRQEKERSASGFRVIIARLVQPQSTCRSGFWVLALCVANWLHARKLSSFSRCSCGLPPRTGCCSIVHCAHVIGLAGKNVAFADTSLKMTETHHVKSGTFARSLLGPFWANPFGHPRIWPKPHLARIGDLGVLAMCVLCLQNFGRSLQDFWWVSSRFLVAVFKIHWTSLSPPAGRPLPAQPKISLFAFSLPPEISFSLWGVFSLNFGGVFEGWGAQKCMALGLLCETPATDFLRAMES